MALTTQNLIDQHLLYQEGLGTGRLKARRKFKRNLQRALDYLWNLREFQWTVFGPESGTVTNASGRTYIDIAGASNFVRFGANGLVAFDQRELRWVPKLDMERLYQTAPSAGGGTPQVYTDPEITGAGNPSSWAIYVYPPVADPAGHTATISYKFRSPTLHDAGDGDVTPDELNLFPDQWRDPLLYELAVLYEMKDKGNIQAIAIQKGIVNENLRNYLATERSGSAAEPVMRPFVPRGYRRALR